MEIAIINSVQKCNISCFEGKHAMATEEKELLWETRKCKDGF